LRQEVVGAISEVGEEPGLARQRGHVGVRALVHRNPNLEALLAAAQLFDAAVGVVDPDRAR
jgi:hypothetical protein